MSERVSFAERVRFANEIGRLKEENAELRKELAVTNPLFETLNAANDRLLAENAKLRELCKLFAEYVSHDRCEGCVCKSRCNDGEIEECWQRTEIREIAHELGIEVD